MALWSGRFAGGPAEEMLAYSESLSVDFRMFEEDVEGSLAHLDMLAARGIVSSREATAIRAGLLQVREELREGTYLPDLTREDIHMAVEARLIELVGDIGGRLHTARSRNDQVATDVRLWLRKRVATLDEVLAGLLRVLLARVEKDGRTLIPGYTHLQRGQPVWLGHHLLAHAWPLSRDRERVADALRRADACPLGAGAMAGTPHPIDRLHTARTLGFAQVVENAMDAVSARDHMLEAASVCAIVMVHLSRMAEELVIWSSQEFALVRLSEAYATGSSIMPQKRNPDAAELVRGKSARVVGDLQALLVLVKGLPLAYNRDLQEDREALFDALDTTISSVRVMAGMWETLTVNRERFAAEMAGDFLLATEVADFLVTRGVPFRDAHHAAGRLVRWCEERGGNFTMLTDEALREAHPHLVHDDLKRWLDPEQAAERRRSHGGTAWAEVLRQVALLEGTLR